MTKCEIRSYISSKFWSIYITLLTLLTIKYYENNVFNDESKQNSNVIKTRNRKKSPSVKTPAIAESMNMDILGSWCIKSTLYKRFVNGKKFFKKLKYLMKKIPSFVKGSFCTPHSKRFNFCFWQDSFAWKCCVLIWFLSKNGTPVLWRGICFSENNVSNLKCWKLLKLPVIIT